MSLFFELANNICTLFIARDRCNVSPNSYSRFKTPVKPLNVSFYTAFTSRTFFW